MSLRYGDRLNLLSLLPENEKKGLLPKPFAKKRKFEVMIWNGNEWRFEDVATDNSYDLGMSIFNSVDCERVSDIHPESTPEAKQQATARKTLMEEALNQKIADAAWSPVDAYGEKSLALAENREKEVAGEAATLTELSKWRVNHPKSWKQEDEPEFTEEEVDAFLMDLAI